MSRRPCEATEIAGTVPQSGGKLIAIGSHRAQLTGEQVVNGGGHEPLHTAALVELETVRRCGFMLGLAADGDGVLTGPARDQNRSDQRRAVANASSSTTVCARSRTSAVSNAVCV